MTELHIDIGMCVSHERAKKNVVQTQVAYFDNQSDLILFSVL